MDLSQAKTVISTVLITASIPLLLGLLLYLENPDGILLYTPRPGPRPTGTPAFTIGAIVGVALSFALSLCLLLLGAVAAYFARSEASKNRVKKLCTIAVAAMATSIAGSFICAALLYQAG